MLAILAAVLAACAHGPDTGHRALMQRGDCAELLRAADEARARDQGDLAAELAASCAPDRFSALIEKATPAQALLWCGRAAAAQRRLCDADRVSQLAGRLHPRVTIGPPDEGMVPEPMLAAALAEIGPELNLDWNAISPDVVVGTFSVSLDHVTAGTSTTVPDAKGVQQRVPATQHRFVARALAQVGLSGKTRMLQATEEARDLTWDSSARPAIAAKFEPRVPPAEELKKRATLGWLRALAKALAASPPEAVDVTDDRGCVAYGLSLNLASGDPGAAASGAGEPAKIAACEHLLGEPAGAGIPVP
jgi:hypothetical protein